MVQHLTNLESILAILLLNICFTYSDLQQNCGTALSTGKIVGGYDLGFYKYPWFASLQKNGVAWCAGTLIGPGVVVSAAHCFKRSKDSMPSKLEDWYKVKLGFYNNCDTNEAYKKIYNVKKVFVHDEYFKQKPYFDIALLILEGDTSAYQPACVTTQASNSGTRAPEAFIQGLGDIKFESGKYPCALREARVLIYNDKDCQNMLKKEGETTKLNHAFCAGYLEGGIDACQGDSGGPLVTINNERKYYLLGVTSFGFECAAKDTLGIYTDVSHFIDWIKSKTNLTLTEGQGVGNQTNPTQPTFAGAVIPTSFVPNSLPPNVQISTGNSTDGGIKVTIEIKNENKKHKMKGKRKNKWKSHGRNND